MNYDYIKQKKILLVDDEESLCQMVCSIFQKENYTRLRMAGTMTEALAICKEWKPDFAVLDVMLPDGDGISLLEKMRKFTEIPVLFLTALGEDEDRLKGLLAGADDYLVKPFLPQELLLRTAAILRRTYKEETPLVTLSGSQIDFSRAEVIKGKEQISLTAKEYEILQALYRNAGRIVTIDQLCEAAWGENPFGYENSLMAHIRRIREKIELTP